MKIGFVTLFPEVVRTVMGASILGRGQDAGHLELAIANPRDFAEDKHKTVDDRPFGGGPGMVMMAPIADAALQSICDLNQDIARAIVATDPAGHLFTQKTAHTLAGMSEVIFICGHYEGIDERFISRRCTHRLSIGDYVLTGGEIPALAMADAIARLVPGVLGDPESLAIDSHASGLLGAPQFTKPMEWEGLEVPAVLRSGNHEEIEKWKRAQALRTTRERRPDLFAFSKLVKKDADMLSS